MRQGSHQHAARLIQRVPERNHPVLVPSHYEDAGFDVIHGFEQSLDFSWPGFHMAHWRRLLEDSLSMRSAICPENGHEI